MSTSFLTTRPPPPFVALNLWDSVRLLVSGFISFCGIYTCPLLDLVLGYIHANAFVKFENIHAINFLMVILIPFPSQSRGQQVTKLPLTKLGKQIELTCLQHVSS